MHDITLKSLKNRSFIIRIIIFIIASVSIFAFVHVKFLKSGAYLYAKQYLLTDMSIKNKYGTINDVNLNLFGCSSSESDMYGNAELRLSISTVSGAKSIVVRLNKTRGVWSVTSVSDIN